MILFRCESITATCVFDASEDDSGVERRDSDRGATESWCRRRPSRDAHRHPLELVLVFGKAVVSYNYDSTAIQPQFDRATTIRRHTLRPQVYISVRGLLHCGLNK